MAVTTTPQQLITAAYAKSSKNQPGKIATESTELLAIVNRMFRGYYAFAARVNPLLFGTKTTVAFSSPGWPRPDTAELVFRIEKNSDHTEVVVVPYEDRDAEAGLPAVYRLGGVYIPASANAPNPQSGSLDIFASKRSTDAGTLGTPVDATWIEAYNELPTLDIAIYLATKDGRQEEVGPLTAERNRWAQLFGSFLEHETANERRRFGQVARFNTPSMVPTFSLLTGGEAAGGGSA